ncbi:acetylglutamate kinase [Lysinibacillus sp. fkY74-1]|uniref:Acetylglutamate kinase n=3 Tax=Lysinibacillus TaxID=400634 RepID=W7RXR5_LYSSH|nr:MULTISPECIES: acetylglutamate kinase [Lysinibacillus]MBE5084594.1 acetylglutamate kinase [Bacillus thuringiensis]AMO32486.1 acetyl-L-glutamate 5-phosphotransferase [Lysinibacillus sphaericus]AMR92413.1 acetyl-L-glutamate 5-phosphotransferase [Lysinibacillus sphaericus]ANA46462.1 acetyl-L-glutamate 5-phosphotransferase [Lysinibacillus sphaericus]EWH32075.1 acetyl-L-glutamate 5-phosphotransferase [Lysinibacillus sphaericus CBAM5]
MTTSKSTHHTARKRMVIKLGGSTLEGLNKDFFYHFKKLQDSGVELIITHGGGPAINRELAARGIESHTLNGIRVTNEAAMNVVQSTLIGQVNPALVHDLTSAGVEAIGLNGYDGQLMVADYLDKDVYGYVGAVKAIHTALLEALLSVGIVPVIACVGVSEAGQALNINGDTVASEIALALGADSLLLVTDVSGIRVYDEYQTMATPTLINQWIEQGHLYGGMIPKVQGAIDCLRAGIPSVQIVGETLIGTTIVTSDKLHAT